MIAAHAAEQFVWEPQPEAEAVVTAVLRRVAEQLPGAAVLQHRLLAEAGVRLSDAVDTIYLSYHAELLADAERAGWEFAEANDGYRIFRNQTGVFPHIAVDGDAAGRMGIDLKVESVAHYLFAHQVQADIEGKVDRICRRATVEQSDAAALGVIERVGWRGICSGAPEISVADRQSVYESLLTRPRPIDDDRGGFAELDRRLDSAIARVGRDVTCALFFASERAFWMRRNRAGMLQYQRQQALGIGWANHDHHTYRSSREHFASLVAIWEKLGLACRERFYAGRQAGWGAQVMEQPATGIVTFNDVDLSPDELFGDFSHDGLAPRDSQELTSLGTIGLWCGLHGESLTAAGMHHLEAMFGFDALRDQLIEAGVKVMKPFTDFGYLRQAFTEGERWGVSEVRLQALLDANLITAEQADGFRANGALGSHLENLERNAGFKGFNQTGVSEIIAATDPRLATANSRSI